MTKSEMVQVVNVAEIAQEVFEEGRRGWTSFAKALTPALPRLGHLEVNLSRVPRGQSACPLHTHRIEDEVFFVMSGRGVFRYGEQVREVGPGDCISCEAGTGIGHQIANPFEEDLTYLAIGMNDPNEVCTYPDSGQLFVRGLGLRGFLTAAEYFDGQPDPPLIMMGEVMGSGASRPRRASHDAPAGQGWSPCLLNASSLAMAVARLKSVLAR